MIKLSDTIPSVQLSESIHYNKPKEILGRLDSLIVQSLAHSLLQIEELLQNQLERFARKYDPTFLPENIRFRVEVRELRFTFIPENFYTYLLSEGEAVNFQQVFEKNIFESGTQKYFFRSGEDFGILSQKNGLSDTGKVNLGKHPQAKC